MTILRPLSGDPGTVRALADRLAGQGELLLALASTVRSLGDPSRTTWEGPGGAAFGARSRTAASLLVSVGRRYAVSAVALRPLAAALAEAQHDASWAVTTHAEAWQLAVTLGNRRVTAQESADPTQRAVAADVHRKELEQLELVQIAERRHAAAWQRFAEADRRCASVLHQLVQDGLDDSRMYDSLTGLSRGAGVLGSAAGGVAMAPTPPSKALGVVAGACDGLQLTADVAVKVGYGDGDWGRIGVGAALSVTGAASGVLKRGALATNPAALASPTRTARRSLRFGTAQRLRLATAEELRRAGRAEYQPDARTFRTFRATRSPGSPTATAHWVAEQVAGRARVLVRNKWLDDLALVTRDPDRSRTMFVTGLAAEATAAGLGAVGTGRDLYARHDGDLAMRTRDATDARGTTPDPDPRPGAR